MFFMSDTTEDCTLKELQLITYAIIKLTATGLYTKAIEQWSGLDSADRQQWSQFCPFIIGQYERMLRESGGPTAGQQGYGSSFHAAEETINNNSAALILESVTRYAERATAAESEVSDLKTAVSVLQQQMAAMAMG